MKLSELKAMAQLILDIPEKVGEFTTHEFTTKCSGTPRNLVNLNVAYKTQEFKYNTTANGAAFSGSIGILCRDTGTMDKQGRKIYIDPENTVFVYIYTGSSPESFDYGALVSPTL